jgi:hypothetical protein
MFLFGVLMLFAAVMVSILYRLVAILTQRAESLFQANVVKIEFRFTKGGTSRRLCCFGNHKLLLLEAT